MNVCNIEVLVGHWNKYNDDATKADNMAEYIANIN